MSMEVYRAVETKRTVPVSLYWCFHPLCRFHRRRSRAGTGRSCARWHSPSPPKTRHIPLQPVEPEAGQIHVAQNTRTLLAAPPSAPKSNRAEAVAPTPRSAFPVVEPLLEFPQLTHLGVPRRRPRSAGRHEPLYRVGGELPEANLHSHVIRTFSIKS